MKSLIRYGSWGMAALFVAMVTLFALSCQTTTPTEPERGLKLSEDKTVGFNEHATSLLIDARLDWSLEVTEGDDWITPDVSEGKAGITTVNFALGENTDGQRRTGRVTVMADGEENPYLFSITQNPQNEINAWIYEQLRGWYYWNGSVKAATPPANSLSYDKFFDNLIFSLKDARDTSENPATIDGGYYSDGTRYIYSFIERFPAGTRVGESSEVTFGFGAERFRIIGSNGQPTGNSRILVLWVQPGGVAEKAGLKRGTWITEYNGARITEDSYEAFWYQLHHLQGGTQMSLTDDKGARYNLTAVETKVSPVIHHEVITTAGGKKAAYLVYNGFEMGENEEFHTELREVFGEFKSAGVNELILDLRYNPGGYVNTCRLLTGLIADVGTSDVFVKIQRNKDINEAWRAAYNRDIANPEILRFLPDANLNGNGLKLRKVYVLATQDSASASELVISSIRGVLGDGAVVHIGTETNGKNVGMDLRETTMEGYRYEMWPITFKLLNAKDFADYAGGFTPNLYIDELRYAARDGLYLFGNPKERLLEAALKLIDGGAVTPDPQTRVADTERQPVSSPVDNSRRGGAKYIPDMQQ